MKGSIHIIIMNKDLKIYIAGHTGLVGTAIVKKFREHGFDNLVTRKHSDLDLTCQSRVDVFFNQEKPDVVILGVAKVGGIMSNYTYPAEHIYENLMIECNVINAAYKTGTKYLLFLGSVCIYPKDAPEPVKESALLTGILEPTNEYYAIAKITGLKLCEAYNRQYGTSYRTVMPANLYGFFDNFHPDKSHVIPGLIRKLHDAKNNDLDHINIWGTGNVRREFLYVDDMADACLLLVKEDYKNKINADDIKPINIGVGKDILISDLVKLIKEIVGYKGNIMFDKSKPDGTSSRLMDSSRIRNMGWKHKVGLNEGIQKTYKWFLENQDLIRM